jgi:RNA polymerase sigma-70 factor (ECF subfamily)
MKRIEEEQELANRCRQGDNLARKQLYEQYAGRMLVLCFRYAGDKETARDWMHDGFLKIFGSFDKFTYRGNGSLRAWMERVMINLAIQKLRQNNQYEYSGTPEEVADSYDQPDAESIETIPQEVLMQFIAELPMGYRTVFNLYVFDNLSHKEIAAQMGINENSSTSQLARAKATLAKKIKEWMRTNYE